MSRTKRSGLLGALVCVLVLLLALAASSSSSRASTKRGSVRASAKSSFKLGVVTDIGGLNDHGFNHLAYEGMLEAEKQLGVQGTVLPATSSSDYVPDLATLARDGDNLVVATGFDFETALGEVAKEFPKTHFALIDDYASNVPGKPKNVEGLLFTSQQSGYLVGYLAGLVSKSKGYKAISSVGGQDIPSVTAYIVGYQAGAKASDPGIKLLNGFSDDFADQAKCLTIAQNQIQEGAKIVFQVAGGCGLGALQAAKQAGDYGIGVDADQSFLGSYILTSAEKHVDKAVVRATKDLINGHFFDGGDIIGTLANNGVGYGKLNAEAAKFAPQLKKIEAEIISGKIKTPKAQAS
jgi:basic membrane protein A